MKMTIESKVAKTILQRGHEVKVGKKVYQVAPPSTATLILVSELVAQMPQINLDENDVINESLRIAKDCKVIGDIVAVLILGAKKSQGRKSRFFGLIQGDGDKQMKLASALLYDLRPIELSQLIQKLLVEMEISFFFSTSTFLGGINLTRATKTDEMIQSGQ